jgi:two-component system cell cycle response regulator DivK
MKTILLIEDNADNARLVVRIMTPYGYRILHASDGESGLQMAFQDKPDLILLDLGLPDLDGQTLIGLIKAMPGLEPVPVVIITAWPPDTAQPMVKAYGCDGYIAKPISARVFPTQIATYLQRPQSP